MSKKIAEVRVFSKQHVERPGVHSKCKTSNLKSSKNYKKKYKGQGR